MPVMGDSPILAPAHAQHTIHKVICMNNTPAEHPIHRWIKTDCGRAKYAELAGRQGLAARVRLGWFVLIAALRDWRLPDQPGGSEA